MLFNSIDFLFFFPITTTIYFILPKKVRYIWLLFSSYYFYMGWNAKYVFLLLGVTVITYLSGLLMDIADKLGGKKNQKLKKGCAGGAIVLNLLLLCYFKYMNYLIGILNQIRGGGYYGRQNQFQPWIFFFRLGFLFLLFRHWVM